jgi:copper resistance protein C
MAPTASTGPGGGSAGRSRAHRVRSRAGGRARLAALTLASGALGVLGASGLGPVGSLVAPAGAHARLEATHPAAGETIDKLPHHVSVTLDAKPATLEGDPLAVYAPGGERIDTGEPWLEDDHETVGVLLDPEAEGPAGDYELVYRVVSADNHLITGRVAFTTSAAGPPSERTTPADAQPPAEGTATALDPDDPHAEHMAAGEGADGAAADQASKPTEDQRPFMHGFDSDVRPRLAAVAIFLLLIAGVARRALRGDGRGPRGWAARPAPGRDPAGGGSPALRQPPVASPSGSGANVAGVAFDDPAHGLDHEDRPDPEPEERPTVREEPAAAPRFSWAPWAPAGELPPPSRELPAVGDPLGPDDHDDDHVPDRVKVIGRRDRARRDGGPVTPPGGVPRAARSEFEEFWMEAESKLTSRVERRAARLTPPGGTPAVPDVPADFYAGSAPAQRPAGEPASAPPGPTPPAPRHTPAEGTPAVFPPPLASTPAPDGHPAREELSADERQARRRSPAPWYRTDELPIVPAPTGEHPAVPSPPPEVTARYSLHSGEVPPVGREDAAPVPPAPTGPVFHASSGEHPAVEPRPEHVAPAHMASPPSRSERPAPVSGPPPLRQRRPAGSASDGPPPLPHRAPRRPVADESGEVKREAAGRPTTARWPQTGEHRAAPAQSGEAPAGRSAASGEAPAFVARSGPSPASTGALTSPTTAPTSSLRPAGGSPSYAPVAPHLPGVTGSRGPRSHEIPAVSWADDPLVAAYSADLGDVPAVSGPVPAVGESSWNEADRLVGSDDTAHDRPRADRPARR